MGQKEKGEKGKKGGHISKMPSVITVLKYPTRI